MSNDELSKLFQLAVDKLADSELKTEISASGPLNLAALPAEATTEAEPGMKEHESESGAALANLIREMNVAQRIKLAMFGNQTARTILLRDTNRLIPLFVLENPRITDNEIVELSRNAQADDTVLRALANNVQWMKNYAVKLNLISNPKTPIDAALRWLKFIKDKDLGRLAKSKNIPQVIASQSRKMLEKRQSANKPG